VLKNWRTCKKACVPADGICCRQQRGIFTGSNGSAIGGAELGGGCRSRPCARGACIASVCVNDDRAVCSSFSTKETSYTFGEDTDKY